MRDAAVAAASLILGALLGGGGAYRYLTVPNPPSEYEVRMADRCVTDKGFWIKLDYNGIGEVYVRVLPPAPVAKAPEKEKKQ